MQKGQEIPQGQMVSGHYVAPSWTQQLGTLANAYMGGNMAEQNEAKSAKLAQLLRGQNESEVKNILEKTFGSPDYKPESMPEIQRDDQGNLMPAIPQTGVAPNKEAALLAGLTATSPIGQMIGQNLLSKKLAGPTYHNVAAGASLLQETPNGIKQVYTAPKEQKIPDILESTAYRLGINPNPSTWTPEQRMAIDQKIVADKRAGATNVSVNTGKAYGQEFGNLMAKQDIDKYTIAQNAPKIVQQSLEIKNLINKGALTGTGADFALSAAKAFNLGGANNAEKIKNTEMLVSSLGQNVLNNIKTSGLGAGQGFTDKDRQFLERVVGGQITLDKNTIVQLANLQEKAAKATVNQWNERIKTMPKEVLQTTGIGAVELPKENNPNSIFNAADAIIGR
jgi:hypothetical protein